MMEREQEAKNMAALGLSAEQTYSSRPPPRFYDFCRGSLPSYFPNEMYSVQEPAIQVIEQAAYLDMLQMAAMPRNRGKTTLLIAAALWSQYTTSRCCVLFLSPKWAASEAARSVFLDMQKLLGADWSRSVLFASIWGEGWRSGKLAIDGERVIPDLVLIDDPSTCGVEESPKEYERLLDIVTKDVRGINPHRSTAAVLLGSQALIDAVQQQDRSATSDADAPIIMENPK